MTNLIFFDKKYLLPGDYMFHHKLQRLIPSEFIDIESVGDLDIRHLSSRPVLLVYIEGDCVYGLLRRKFGR